MKKKQVCLIFASLCAVSFCGCYNMRTDPNESLDKATFGEVLEHYLLFAHDCRRSPEECIPICIEDQKQFDRNQAEEQRKWEAFKNTPPPEYIPTRIMMVNNLNKILINVSKQIQYEVVIPYKELDKQGHVQAYRQFCADVDCTMKASRVNYYTAVQKTYKYWETRYGTERCQQLMAAIPFIENLRANQLLWKTINHNWENIQRFIREIDKARKQLEEKAKTIEGKIEIGIALTSTAQIVLQSQESLAYLADLQKQQYQKERDIRAAIERIQKYNNSND